MTRKSLLLTTIASALLLTGMAAGCGGYDDPSPATGTTASDSAPAKSADAGDNDGSNKGNGPASANDESKDAPDNAISDRPGGPNDQGDGGKNEKKTGEGSVSGDIDAAPVNPVSP
ncbi:MAG: hypothetical protein JJE13_01095 [Thermoleophilia bacterium]|nr:hypothetical protein [Thermoleophilia bacterium]